MFWKKRKFEGLDELSSRSRQYTRGEFQDDGIVSVHINSTGPATTSRKPSEEPGETGNSGQFSIENRALETHPVEFRKAELRPRTEPTPIRTEPPVRSVSSAPAPARPATPQPLHAATQSRPLSQPLRAVETAERLERIDSRLQGIEQRLERLDRTLEDLIGVLEKVPVEYIVSLMESRSSNDQIEKLASLLEAVSNKVSSEPEPYSGSNGRRVRLTKRKSADIQAEMFLD